ncbi:TPA: hypothetical protein ACVO0U_003059 [Vibrio alginolyticus]
MSTKCNECFGGLFWKTAFGKWFADAAKRQSPDSMPTDEDDIKRIYGLWCDWKSSCGWELMQGELVKKYEYHICHRDPAKGDGFQGRFTYGNLMIAGAKVNQSAKNQSPIDHGYRVNTDKKPFGTAAKVRQWCGGQYKLNQLVDELDLKKYQSRKELAKDSSAVDFLPEGVPPAIVHEKQLRRFEGGSNEPWKRVLMSTSQASHGALVYGIGLGSGKPLEGSNGPERGLDGEDF